MPENNGKAHKTTTPHYRLTLQDVARDYRDKLLTVKGAVFYAVASSRKLGQLVRINPPDFAKQLGVDKSTVYRAISQLKVENRIEFETDGNLFLKIPLNESVGIPEYIFLEGLLQKDHRQLQIDHSELQKDHRQLQIDHSELQKDRRQLQKCNKKAPETLTDADSGSPQLIQSMQLIQSLSGENGERDEELEEKFRNWLRDRANLLPEKPALLERWIDSEAKKESNKKEFLSYLTTLQRTSVPSAPAAFQKIPDELQEAIASGDRARAYKLVQENLSWGLTVGDVAQLIGGNHA